MADNVPRPAAVSAPAGEATGYDATLDGSECACGHEYSRHFDSYDGMAPIGCKYCACAAFTAISPRSPAPASGAPDEEVTSGAAEAIAAEIDRLARDVPVGESFNGGGMHGAAVYDCMRYAAGLVRQIGRRSPDVSAEAAENDALRTRLAASERAGVAMREALLGNDPAMPPALQPLSTIETAIALACDMAIQDHGESDEDYESVWSALMDARQACKTLRAALSPTSPAPSPEPSTKD